MIKWMSVCSFPFTINIQKSIFSLLSWVEFVQDKFPLEFFFLHVLFPTKYNNRKQYEQIFSFGTLIFPQLYCFELQSTNILYWIIICVDLVNFMDHFHSLRSFICVTLNFVVTVALLSSFHQIEFMRFWSSNKS